MIYQFSDLALDLDRHELTRDGAPVQLTRLSFKALQVLVQAAPALVSHDDLIDQVWGPGRVITPENLAQRMKTLRQSLGDSPSVPRYIEGVRGQGYRLVPEVMVSSAEAPGKEPGPRWLKGAAAALVLVLLGWFAMDRMSQDDSEQMVSGENARPAELEPTGPVQKPAIAVLPFANLSADASNQFFADGIHDDLLTRISNIRDIKTISRTSVMTYRGSDKKLGAIAEELGVGTILEGGVQRSGDQVKINLQLIDAETDAHLWAQTYTRALTASNVFAVQAEITEAVAGALRAILSEDERLQLRKQPTANLEALDAYFLGNQYFDQHTSESTKQATAAFQQAIDLDPEFSAAHSNLALAILEQVWLGGIPAQAQLEKSRPFIDQAILLDPQSTIAFTALGQWFRIAGDYDKAEQAFEKALEFAPNNAAALSNYGSMKQWERSDSASAIRFFRQAVELDPQNVGHKIQLAETLGRAGQATEGIALMEQVVIDQPSSPSAHRVLGGLYSIGQFRHDKAVKSLRKAYELDPGHAWNSFFIALAYYHQGDFERSALWLDHAARLAPDSASAPDFRGWAKLNSGDYPGAREHFAQSSNDGDMHWSGVFRLARIDLAEGRPDDAVNRYEAFMPRFDGRKTFINLNYAPGAARAFLELDEHEKAQALIDAMMAAIKAESRPQYHQDLPVLIASLHVVAGRPETAIELLSDWVEQGGASSRMQILSNYELSALSDDSRFQQLLQTVDARLAEQKANITRWEASGEMLPIPEEVL